MVADVLRLPVVVAIVAVVAPGGGWIAALAVAGWRGRLAGAAASRGEPPIL
jgi:hypothetical protein